MRDTARIDVRLVLCEWPRADMHVHGEQRDRGQSHTKRTGQGRPKGLVARSRPPYKRSRTDVVYCFNFVLC